ncbi:phosphatidylinositol-specific phospholipase C/glycerophosphodiester phosphodiesterase family protein [Streptomyces roseifaciens]
MSLRTRRSAVVGLGAALGAALTGSFATPVSATPTPVSATPALAGPAAGRDASGAPGRPPLRRAHAHNDYEHTHPLADALSYGFGSVEADIWLVGGRLLVAHDASGLDPSRTLEALYLDPLERRVRAGHGRVYPGHNLSLQLLVDIKTDGAATYRELSRRLRRYGTLFTSCADGRIRRGAVTAVVSGDRGARGPMAGERLRHAFYDGRLADLGGGSPASFIPLVSDNWSAGFGWQGVGPMPAAERARLRRIVSAAHAEGRRVRFWATPDRPGPAREAVWRELLSAGVDVLNTDDLAGLEAFLRAAG